MLLNRNLQTSARAHLLIRGETIGFQHSFRIRPRGPLARMSKSFERPCALAGATIPVNKYHAGHARASAARACRTPSKTFVTIANSGPHFSQTYEQVEAFQRKSSTFHRARFCRFIWKTKREFHHSCPRRPRGPLARACRTSPLRESSSHITMGTICSRACRNSSKSFVFVAKYFVAAIIS